MNKNSILSYTLPQNTKPNTMFSRIHCTMAPDVVHLNLCSLQLIPHPQSLFSPSQDYLIFNLPLHFLLQLLNLHILVRFTSIYYYSSRYPVNSLFFEENIKILFCIKILHYLWLCTFSELLLESFNNVKYILRWLSSYIHKWYNSFASCYSISV